MGDSSDALEVGEMRRRVVVAVGEGKGSHHKFVLRGQRYACREEIRHLFITAGRYRHISSIPSTFLALLVTPPVSLQQPARPLPHPSSQPQPRDDQLPIQ
ncbi:Os08g0226633 [Oryza sativa Japonica Group]|uniref:Os08g0226633 protein n=1 Tax=Oryza sativa subsp. japonica TaxID=39947 RepID=A0A0P0XDD1_ORYSJ|nr:Os08g0226633 [Oryza sativa Japonica Group]